MNKLSQHTFVITLSMLFAGLAHASPAREGEQSRGELLYSTHCIACHTTHVHWRDKRLATDWQSLNKQVQRWQSNTRLGWNEADVKAVARYLNTLYYHFPDNQQSESISLSEESRD